MVVIRVNLYPSGASSNPEIQKRTSLTNFTRPQWIWKDLDDCLRFDTAWWQHYSLWNSCDDAVLSSLVVEALRVPVGVAVEVRSEAASVSDGLTQQAGTLGTRRGRIRKGKKTTIGESIEEP